LAATPTYHIKKFVGFFKAILFMNIPFVWIEIIIFQLKIWQNFISKIIYCNDFYFYFFNFAIRKFWSHWVFFCRQLAKFRPKKNFLNFFNLKFINK
jgi:hypothetical protein